MEKLAGYVEHIIYRNADNGYTVLNLVSGEAEITCVGIFSAIAEGENIEASGDYTDHPTYGKQFKVESFEEKAPEDEEEEDSASRISAAVRDILTGGSQND